MTTLKPVTVFDLCPDIEGLIMDELKVLLKFREASKELKLRIHLNKKSLKKKENDTNGRYVRGLDTPFNTLQHVLFPFLSKTTFDSANSCMRPGCIIKSEKMNIHGIVFTPLVRKANWGNAVVSPDVMNRDAMQRETTIAELNEILTMLTTAEPRIGLAKKFKSKSKAEKIKMLMNY
jgi:hypothetical protein